MREFNTDISNVYLSAMAKLKTVKVRMVMSVLLHNNFSGDEEPQYLTSRNEILLNKTQIR